MIGSSVKILPLIGRADYSIVLNDFVLAVMNFIFSLQAKMTVPLEVIGISNVNRVTGCWFARTGCPAVIGPAGERETSLLLPMSPSCEEKPLLPAMGRIASPGAVETGKVGAGWER